MKPSFEDLQKKVNLFMFEYMEFVDRELAVPLLWFSRFFLAFFILTIILKLLRVIE